MVKEISFEVGKSYYDKSGNLKECIKRTDKSIWLGEIRYNITSYPSQYNDYTEATNYHSADNNNDVENQRTRTLQQLLLCVEKVRDNEPCECVCKNELEIYNLCNDLKCCLEEYLKDKS